MSSEPFTLSGFPLADHVGEHVSKADLFLVTSALFRICSVQNRALKSVMAGETHVFAEELADADQALEQLYAMLQSER